MLSQQVGQWSGAPFGMELLQDGQRLYCDAGDHLLGHDLAPGVPHIPQTGPQHVHDLHGEDIELTVRVCLWCNPACSALTVVDTAQEWPGQEEGHTEQPS